MSRTAIGHPKTDTFSVRVPIAGLTGTGTHVNVRNLEGRDLLIVDRWLDIATASSGACTLHIGVTPTSETTSSDNLMTGINVAAVALLDTSGANGARARVWPSGAWVTVTGATGSMAGLVATLQLMIAYRG